VRGCTRSHLSSSRRWFCGQVSLRMPWCATIHHFLYVEAGEGPSREVTPVAGLSPTLRAGQGRASTAGQPHAPVCSGGPPKQDITDAAKRISFGSLGLCGLTPLMASEPEQKRVKNEK